MSLSTYKKKRSFDKTPEPEGGKPDKNQLRFVIQKHEASHLHYDFRLEMEGVLKSWAVPKGPSTDPSVKRLAMMVEDHPYDYRTFEGIIPKGNYGAGTVIVWDEGTYEIAETSAQDKSKQEKDLLHQLYQGKIKFKLHGEKLKGEFALVKAASRGENAWLLMKLEDEFASKKDITKEDESVQSGKTIKEVAATSDVTWQSNRKAATKASKSQKKPVPVENSIEASLASKGRKSAFPQNIKPMLATLASGPFDGSDWLFEIKWDGYRAVGYFNQDSVELRSRSNLNYTKYSTIEAAMKLFDKPVVVDGEIVALNEEGTADFQALQAFEKDGRKADLVYYLFDLLWWNGKDYTRLPLTERKEILRNIIPPDQTVIRYSDHITGSGTAFFNAAMEKGLEGIMGKKCDSTYEPGARTKNWLKIKNNQKTEAIICGFTQGRNSRKYFGAIVLGKYKGSKLQYIGHSGSGFTEKSLKDLYKKLEPLITAKCPFEKPPKTNMPVTWVKPHYVCEVKFTEWTGEDLLRHPIFLGLREDKTAENEKNEKIVSPPSNEEKAVKKEPVKKKRTKAGAKKGGTDSRLDEVLLSGDENEMTVEVGGRSIKFTNLNKIYWPEEKITKRQMLNYYYSIIPFILPYMKDRPQSLNRHPNGIDKPGFYQKNVEGKVPDWIETYPYKSESDGEKKEFLVCTDEATIMYMASLGCIEMNPWHSRISAPENPDWCVIDLDPDTNSYDEVVEAALTVKDVLDQLDVPVFPKTSGATGMHLYIPFGAKYSYDQSRLFAQMIVEWVHQRIPSFTSLERSPSKRKGKIYLDFLQNRSIQTIAAPYSVRPKPHATVSTPLFWDEVKKGLTPTSFTIFSIKDRLKEVGDIFQPVLTKGIDLEKVLEKASEMQ